MHLEVAKVEGVGVATMSLRTRNATYLFLQRLAGFLRDMSVEPHDTRAHIVLRGHLLQGSLEKLVEIATAEWLACTI